MYVEADDKRVFVFLEDAIPAFEESIITHPCPNCGTGVRFPVVAKQSQVNSFNKIIEVAKEYIEPCTEKILDELYKRLIATIKMH